MNYLLDLLILDSMLTKSYRDNEYLDRKKPSNLKGVLRKKTEKSWGF